ncbi:MAG: VOC family protein [Pyrinomonadaceae bacterium]|nr:VOC family protein [Pyrinomonadaceae bacterium]
MKVVPYLSFEGNCEEALEFYRNAFGGELDISRYAGSPMEENVSDDMKNKVLHGRLSIGDLLIMASDLGPEHKPDIGNNIQLNVECSTEDEQTKCFEKLSEGGTAVMPLEDQFWGARFGMVTDKFGVNWMLNLYKSDQRS